MTTGQPRPLAARSAAAAGSALGATAVAHLSPGVTAIGPVRRRFFSRLSGYGDAGHVALTFDDGPDPGSTPAVLDVLAGWKVRATFFMLGSRAADAPSLTRQIAAAGHEVAVHGWKHRTMAAQHPAAVYRDLARARDTMADLTGQEPAWFRPPYGVLTSGALIAARRLELRPLLWTCWGREWDRDATPVSVLGCLLRDLGGGATVLLHDSDQQARPGSARAARQALGPLLAECARRRLRAGPVAEHGL
jgi:peptidoglycan/xylan/chitin deacetylase (PgdA/CDA1 family)